MDERRPAPWRTGGHAGAPSLAGGSRTSHCISLPAASALDYADHTGWTSIFDGKSLDGWSGNPQVWSVENGAITAVSTTERRVGSTHIIWVGGEPADFELKLEIKLEGDIHSGIAYRSQVDEAVPSLRQRGARVPPLRART